MEKEPEFTVNWMGSHLQNWKELLGGFIDKPCRGLELGSYEGRSAIWFVQNILTHKDSRLTCVDMFGSSYAHRYYQNIVVTGVHEKINTIRGDTHETIRRMNGQYFQFAYIDADHRAWAVASDIVMVWPLLVKHGILILDDYKHPDYDCKKGIDFFLDTCKGRYELLEKGWQVIVQKIN